MNSEIWPSIPPSDPPSPYASVTATASGDVGVLANAVRNAFQDAMAMRGRLRDEAFQVEGFSGRKFRLFLNNLIGEVPDPRYLEIGVFHGASFCSAVFRNELRAVGIDDWSWSAEKHTLFDSNIQKFKTDKTTI